MSETEVREIIRQLKQKEIQVFDVPEELKNHRDIVEYERDSGLRVVGKRGYDVISKERSCKHNRINSGSDKTYQNRSNRVRMH